MRLDHVGVQVADLARAADWYCAAFKLEREIELRVDPIDLDIVMLRNAEFGHRVELLHRPGLDAWAASGQPGRRRIVRVLHPHRVRRCRS